MVAEGSLHQLTLARAQQAVVDEDGVAAAADGLLADCTDHARVDTAAEAEHDFAVLAHLFAHAGD